MIKPKRRLRSRGVIVPFAAIVGGVLVMSGYGATQVTTLPTVNMSPGQQQPITCSGGRLVGSPALVKCYGTITGSTTTTGAPVTTSTTTAPSTTSVHDAVVYHDNGSIPHDDAAARGELHRPCLVVE